MINTRLGKVTGVSSNGVQTYLGLPYARPPTGPARWRPPEPVEAWSHLDATTYPNRCLQTPYADILGGREIPGEESEDCLYLNIYTPAADGKRRPVMFWIHGGAYIQGSANEYDGTRLAAENDVVVVIINYRLGIFGFHDLSRYGDAYRGSASLGFQDQIAALGWVHNNIEDYGGDPGNVLVFGESAGGGSVLALLCAPAANGLYHRAAALSPGEVLGPPANNVQALASHLNVSPDNLLDRLMSLTGKELKALQVGGVFNTGTGVDGTVISRTAVDSINAHGPDGAPLIIGSCRDEGTLFTPMFPTPEVAEPLAAGLAYTAGNGHAERYLMIRDSIMRDAGPMEKVERTWYDMFRGSVLRCAEAATRAGSGGWVYNFEVPTENPLGITHASDIAFTFNTLEAGGVAFHDPDNADNQRIARLWSETLARFARTGDPNGDGLPDWPRYDQTHRSCLILDHAPHIESDPDGSQWREAYGM